MTRRPRQSSRRIGCVVRAVRGDLDPEDSAVCTRQPRVVPSRAVTSHRAPPYREAPAPVPPRRVWRVPWLVALLVAAVWAVAVVPMATMFVPASMKLVAPALCAPGTERAIVARGEVVTADSTSTSYTLWCVDREGVRERVGDLPVFGALAGVWFCGVFVLVALAGARRRVLVVAAGALLLTLPGCSWGTIDESALHATTRGYCHSSRGATRAIADLRARIGTPLHARSVTLYADVLMGEFVDPMNPSHVDAWRWHITPATGAALLAPPEPVRVDGRTVAHFDVARVRWDRVSRMVTTTLARAHADGASVSTLSVDPSPEGVRIRVNWIAPRSTGVLVFTGEGEPVESPGDGLSGT